MSELTDGGAEVAAEVSLHEYSSGKKDTRSAKRIRRLSPEELAAFWASLEPLAWWRLTDASLDATDLTSYDVFLSHGGRSVGINCYGLESEWPQYTLVEKIQELGGIHDLREQVSRRGRWEEPMRYEDFDKEQDA